MGKYFSAFDPKSSAIFLAVGFCVRFPRPLPLTMASQKGVGTPSPSLTIIGEDSPDPSSTLHDTSTTTNEVHQYPVRISIRTPNRKQNVNPQAVFKSFLTELSLHDRVELWLDL